MRYLVFVLLLIVGCEPQYMQPGTMARHKLLGHEVLILNSPGGHEYRYSVVYTEMDTLTSKKRLVHEAYWPAELEPVPPKAEVEAR